MSGNKAVGARLSAMMFIQFFIWGSWYVAGPNYLGTIGFGPTDFALMYSVGPIAGILSPFFVGMIADRFFSAERLLGVMHLLACVAMYCATLVMQSDDPSPLAINGLFFLHMLCYFPTLALTNTLALKNMTNPEKQFPLIRVFGTIGWIVAGLILSRIAMDGSFLTRGVFVPENPDNLVTWDKSLHMFHVAALSCLALGLYSFTLPHTPPVKSAGGQTFGQILGKDAFVLFKNRSFLIFMASSFLICIPLAFYYQIASRVVEQTELPIAQTMTYGQMSEIFFMLVMPLFFARFGVKKMLLFGMLAWVARYALFSFGAPAQATATIITGVVLHGICYDFFFVTGQIYTDKIAPQKIRSQAQGMLVLFTLGLGMLIGAQTAGQIEKWCTPIETPISQAKSDVAGAVASLAAEKEVTLEKILKTADEQVSKARESLAEVEKEGDDDAKRIAGERLAFAVAQQEQLAVLPPETGLSELLEERGRIKQEHRQAALRAMDWKLIWGIPAVAAFIVMVLFLIMFRDDPDSYADHSEA